MKDTEYLLEEINNAKSVGYYSSSNHNYIGVRNTIGGKIYEINDTDVDYDRIKKELGWFAPIVFDHDDIESTIIVIVWMDNIINYTILMKCKKCGYNLKGYGKEINCEEYMMDNVLL